LKANTALSGIDKTVELVKMLDGKRSDAS
jgi:hypothetical protein